MIVKELETSNGETTIIITTYEDGSEVIVEK